MRRTTRFALRFLLIVAALALISSLVTSPGPRSSPYLSALSDLAVPQAYAAKKTCNYKACGGSRYSEACNPTTFASSCTNSKGFCIVGNCT